MPVLLFRVIILIIENITPNNRAEVTNFIIDHWYTCEMVVRNTRFDLSKAEGLLMRENGKIIALLTYRVAENFCEILSLDSLAEHRGNARALLKRLETVAKSRGCLKIAVITTNDNLNALKFYQKYGFDIIKLHRFAVKEARKIKPEIPLFSDDGIPIMHEIELELKL